MNVFCAADRACQGGRAKRVIGARPGYRGKRQAEGSKDCRRLCCGLNNGASGIRSDGECYRGRRHGRPSKQRGMGAQAPGPNVGQVIVWHSQSQPSPSCRLVSLFLVYMGVGRLCLEFPRE